MYPTPRIALSVGSSVRDKISAKFQRTISRQRKELPEIRWCQNDRIFEGFLDFPKNMKFWISGFLDFWIFGFLDFFGFLAISQQRKELPEIRWCQNDRIFKGFLDFPKKKYEIFDFWISGFLDFWISGFFWRSGFILATEKAIGWCQNDQNF